jgi:ligand-binding sensor protein
MTTKRTISFTRKIVAASAVGVLSLGAVACDDDDDDDIDNPVDDLEQDVDEGVDDLDSEIDEEMDTETTDG